MIKLKARRHPEVCLAKFKKEYATLTTQKDDNTKKMQELLANPAVAEYAYLISANRKIVSEQRRLYKKIKNIEYQNCQHLWVSVPNWDFSDEQEEPVVCQVCLKCGLNENVILESKSGTYFYNYADEVMYQFMQNYHYKQGLVIDEITELDIASEIYSRIKAKYPAIEDEQIKKYMSIALHNMNIKMQDEVSEEKILKRLFSKKD